MRTFILIGALIVVGLSPAGCAKEDPQQAKANALKGVQFGEPKNEPPAPEPPPPRKKDENEPQVKGNPQPKGLVQGVRAAAYRPERLNDLKNIALFFQQFVDQNNGRNPRTEEEFTDFFKREAGELVGRIKEKHYIVNLKVNMRDGNAVIAYESLQDQGGYQSVRVNGAIEPIPLEELRKLLMP
jgi:hypothetical protein